MKKDEKLTKDTGQPVFKGVMDYDDLDTAPGQESDERAHEDDPADEAEKEWSKPLPKDIG